MSSDPESPQSALGPFRALDLTDETGLYCGRILASLGAEVIKVEPPTGDAARTLPPFVQDEPHPERSLFYSAYNAGKQSVTLNLETADGQAIFKQLVAVSDFVLESFRPGYLNRLGLGYAKLRRINPRIMLTSITPYGQTGPYRNHKPSDLTCSAMSGLMYLTGDPDRAPLRIGAPQAYVMAGAEAAIATLVAHYHRERTGRGQHVDVAIRDAMIGGTLSAIPWWEQSGKIPKRRGVYFPVRPYAIRVLWRCQDGWVGVILYGGQKGLADNRQFVAWLREEGIADGEFDSVDWENVQMEGVDLETEAGGLLLRLQTAVERLFALHTRAELAEQGDARGIRILPVNAIEDIWDDPQLRARGFWEDVEYTEWGTTVAYPGAFVKASATPCARPTRAPRIGEHNAAVYSGLLGMSREQLVVLKAANAI